MRKRIKSTEIPSKVKEDNLSYLPFHLMFPVHLSYKDQEGKKDCYFKDDIDLKKYVKRYKLKPKDCVIADTLPR